MSEGPVIAAIITSAASLVGVLAGFIWNGVMQRRADERRFQADRKRDDEKIEHEARILRTALFAELQSLIRIYEGELDFVSREENHFTWVPTADFFSAYRDNLGKLGYLSAKEVEAVTNCYYTFQERIGYIARNGTADERKSDLIVGRNIPYDLNEPNKRSWICNDLREILSAAQQARDTIKTPREEAGEAAPVATSISVRGIFISNNQLHTT